MKPKIRVKGFSKDWKLIPLTDKDFEIVAGGDIDKNIIKNNGKYPVVANGLMNDGIVGYYDSHYRIKKPAVTVTGRGDVGYAQARPYSFTPVVRLLSIKSSHDIFFLANAINHKKIIQESTGVPQLTTVQLSKNSFYFPDTPEEETEISLYLQHLDLLIQSTSKKIESLKRVKAASLQSMFPQEGETKPRIRFKGFEGDWQTLTIADICEKKSSALSESLLGPDCGKYSVYGAKGYIQNIEYYQFAMPYISIVKDGAGVGRSQLCPAYSSIIGTMQCIIAKENVDVTFLAYLFETLNFSSYIIGSTIPHIYFRDYCSELVKFPSIYEQKMIADYFANLDSQISLQSQRLEKLKQIKAACLDNMFV